MRLVSLTSNAAGELARQFAVKTLKVGLGLPAVLLSVLCLLYLLVGLSPVDLAHSFLNSSAVPLAHALLGFWTLALFFHAIYSFGRWCLTQALPRPDELLSAARHIVLPISLSRFLHDLACCLPAAVIGGALTLHPLNSPASSAPAALSGAVPLLE